MWLRDCQILRSDCSDYLFCDCNWKKSQPGLLLPSNFFFLQFLSMTGQSLGHHMLCDQGFRSTLIWAPMRKPELGSERKWKRSFSIWSSPRLVLNQNRYSLYFQQSWGSLHLAMHNKKVYVIIQWKNSLSTNKSKLWFLKQLHPGVHVYLFFY